MYLQDPFSESNRGLPWRRSNESCCIKYKENHDKKKINYNGPDQIKDMMNEDHHACFA